MWGWRSCQFGSFSQIIVKGRAPRTNKNDKKWPKTTNTDQDWPRMTKNIQEQPRPTKKD